MNQDRQTLIKEIIKKYESCPYPAPKVQRRGKPHTTVDFSGIDAETKRLRDEFYMRCALELASLAAERDEVPVGALVVMGERILSADFNGRETEKDALYHAEVSVIHGACRTLGGWRLPGCELFVTLEPCIMCAGAVISSRLPRVVFGAADAKAGAMGGVFDANELPLNHKAAVTAGILKEESEEMLRRFFEGRRK